MHEVEVGPRYELERVIYTSPTDAAAELYDRGRNLDHSSTVIVTTADNWAHAAGLVISFGLADLVDYLPLGNGAVAIKAEDQFPRRSYPPFVLYPDGAVKPLRVSTEPRVVDGDSELLPETTSSYFADGVGLGPTTINGSGWMLAADVDRAEVFALPRLPREVNGLTFENVSGRDGLVNVAGNLGVRGWRFSESLDKGITWQTTDVPLPQNRPSRLDTWPNTLANGVAVGPSQFQAFAAGDVWQDLPAYLRQLWITEDEKTFHLVPLPRDRMAFKGMVFASDGALLVAEAEDPRGYCGDSCRPGRIWHLPPRGTELKPLAGAPR